jgi:hypothetical protein
MKLFLKGKNYYKGNINFLNAKSFNHQKYYRDIKIIIKYYFQANCTYK